MIIGPAKAKQRLNQISVSNDTIAAAIKNLNGVKKKLQVLSNLGANKLSLTSNLRLLGMLRQKTRLGKRNEAMGPIHC